MPRNKGMGNPKKPKAILTTSVGKNAILITIIYLLAGGLWIILSDCIAYMVLPGIDRFLWFSIVKGLIYVGLTGILIFILVYSAMSKMERATQEAQNKESLLKALFDSIPDIIFYKDKNSIYLGGNHAFETYNDFLLEDFVGKDDYELFGPQLAAQYLKIDREVFESRRPSRSEELYTNKDGKENLFELLKTPYYDEKGQLIGVIGIRRDVTERRRREEEIRFLNHHDVLTGLYNRAYIQQALGFLDQESNFPISVVAGDINGLKLVNDSFGHGEGDRLIVAISQILKNSTRESDVVGRVGGDEFYLILPNTDSVAAKGIIKSIRISCDEHSQALDNDVHFTSISLGQATKVEEGLPLTDYVNIAEEYMYQQKTLDYKSFHSSLLISIKNTMYEKSYETEQHAERLAQQSLKLGQLMNMSDEDLVALQLFATVHDIGKISIDQNILTKKDPLTDEEWRQIRKHPETGYRIANSSPGLMHVADLILCHHEWWDGSGYPGGLKEEQIPLGSRILAVVDAYDAMTHDRSYKKALSKEEAIKELKLFSGTQFDPQLVRLFIKHIV
ncbi:MAG: diguanylate cyclase [Anaerovoracaceae bacterium]|jgi:diguanylate cyclase (GGDEF)-like protein/PAS domain S-box-containing protein|nr:diguanylate cyclase [Anaerovoracaceae bacterium]